MKCQKELFSLRRDVHYLNCAYKSPLLNSAEKACLKSLMRERNPIDISAADFFKDAEKVRQYFGKIVNCKPNNVAIVPSASYGFGSVLNNVKAKKNGNAITIEDEFPSGYLTIQRWARENNNKLMVVGPAEKKVLKAKSWNKNILDQIDKKTSVVLLSAVHWMTGMRFDLEKIGQKCKAVGAILVVDGAQSVGALPIDVQKYKIDALICPTYKWLFGTYSLSLAYISDYFREGKPLEESWLNRTNSREFSSVSDYEECYYPKAGRYNVGETSNFILMPLVRTSLRQIIKWQPAAIQEYCAHLIKPLLKYLKKLNVKLESKPYFSNHLFSLNLPQGMDIEQFKANLAQNNISISIRGKFLRISVNVFNDKKDIKALMKVIEKTLSTN